MLSMEQLLQQQNDSVLDTVRVPHPVGDFTFTVSSDFSKMKIDTGTSDSGKEWARFSTLAETWDPDGKVAAEMGRPGTIFISIMLDLDEQGNIAQGKGQNVDLGQFLAACGMNQRGWAFNQIPGKRFQGRVGHRPNPKKPGEVLADIVAYTAA